jgi:hypothetical protein
VKETYVIVIDRPGMGDIPELCRATSTEAVAAIVRALLDCHDGNIRCVKVQIDRVITKEVGV